VLEALNALGPEMPAGIGAELTAMLRKTAMILTSLLCLSAVGGCYTYSPVRFRVEDAVTRQAVPGAQVKTIYHFVLNYFPPREDQQITDDRGQVTLKIALGQPGLVWASAAGYLGSTVSLTPKGEPVEAHYPDYPAALTQPTDPSLNLKENGSTVLIYMVRP
jgi:hypothetical protein